ncbi:ExbD/TolR family protein [Aquimarina megaterium]|uniref:ExbD/TolR family protein n=1 Tax=Aquimarina megaterium TaxID=1443666 RepID=UPI001111E653|nr:hypothetical protein [Aquimarina megaterium]
MKKTGIINLIVLVLSISLYSQPKEQISLPKGGSEIKTQQSTKNINIYITKEQHVYFENQKLTFYCQISELLSKEFTNNQISPFDLSINILADNGVFYNVIDKVKTEIAKTNNKTIYYQTGVVENLSEGLKDVIPKSLYQINLFSRILTLQERSEMKKLNDSHNIPPPAPSYNYYYHLRSVLSDGSKKEEAKHLLEKLNYANIRLLSNQKIRYKGYDVAISDEKELESILKNHQIVLLHFDENIIYGDYIALKAIIKRITNKYHSKKQYDKISSILEIPAEQEIMHKEIELKL